jgi:hypothetical protein
MTACVSLSSGLPNVVFFLDQVSVGAAHVSLAQVKWDARPILDLLRMISKTYRGREKIKEGGHSRELGTFNSKRNEPFLDPAASHAA